MLALTDDIVHKNIASDMLGTLPSHLRVSVRKTFVITEKGGQQFGTSRAVCPSRSLKEPKINSL